MFGEVMGGQIKQAGDTHASYTWMGSGFLPTFSGLAEGGGPRRVWSSFNSDHTGGIVNFVMADGSVRNISPNVAYGTYIALSGMQDGLQMSALP